MQNYLNTKSACLHDNKIKTLDSIPFKNGAMDFIGICFFINIKINKGI